MMDASSSVEICPSATLVPFVAMSLGLAGEALAVPGREISAPVHVDSSFAACGHPTGEARLQWGNTANPLHHQSDAGMVCELVHKPVPASGSAWKTQDHRIRIASAVLWALQGRCLTEELGFAIGVFP